MQIPNFPECSHALVQPLAQLSDRELLHRFKQNPGAGKYFTAIFCRYSPIVFSLISHSARSPVQAEYLFALTWRHILNELGGLDLPTIADSASATAEDITEAQRSLSLQGWLINVTALCINQAVLPEVEEIHYSLQQASPPLWCYVERAMERLDPVERLILVMSQTFHWSDTRIAAYLQAEGERITPTEVAVRLRTAAQNLEAALPDDIQAIYLGTTAQAGAELMDAIADATFALSPTGAESRN